MVQQGQRIDEPTMILLQVLQRHEVLLALLFCPISSTAGALSENSVFM